VAIGNFGINLSKRNSAVGIAPDINSVMADSGFEPHFMQNAAGRKNLTLAIAPIAID
jgi:hypothetical protein